MSVLLQKTISVLIPACNEESTIGEVVQTHLDSLLILMKQGLIDDFEIVVLDDGSSDETFSKLKAFDAIKQVVVEHNSQPSGIQAAFEKLYSLAVMNWTYLTPGDGQWPAEVLDILIRYQAGVNWNAAVIAVRAKKSKNYSFLRILNSFFFRIYSFLILRVDIKDPGSVKLVPSILNKQKYTCKSVLQEVERLQYLLRSTNYSISTVEAPWSTRRHGRSEGASFSTLTLVFRDLLRYLSRSG